VIKLDLAMLALLGIAMVAAIMLSAYITAVPQ